MPLPKQAPARVDAEHSFVISLADQKLERAPEPLPTTAIVRDKREGPKTQVLAQNQRLDWSQNIGNDAEILAIAQAMGTAPGQGKRTLMLAAGVVAVVAIVLSIAFGGEMLATVQRAFAGKTQKVGTIIVKTRPSPDDVIIDGESKGPGNKKVVNVDIDAPHRIVVKPNGHDPIVREITRKDFDDGLDGTPTFVLEKDYKAPPVDLPETTP